jgi:hypothetical protein
LASRSTANLRYVTANDYDQLWTAVYGCVVGPITLNVITTNQIGTTIPGFRLVLSSQNGTMLAKGFSTDSFTVKDGYT